MVYASGSGRLLLTYNDQSGVAYVDKNDPTLLHRVPSGYIKGVWGAPSFAGLSYSDDLGYTWHKRVPFTPAEPTCLQSYCPTALWGDPWIATNGNDVLYVNLAGVAQVHGDIAYNAINSIAYIWSHDGGLSWAKPKVAHVETDAVAFDVRTAFVDKPSVSIANGTAMIAYWDVPPIQNGVGDGNIHVVTAFGGLFDVWTPDDSIAGTAVSMANPSPIIKVVDEDHAYLGFQSGNRTATGSALTYHVFRLVRSTVGGHTWALGSSALDLPGIVLEPSIPGGPNGNDRPIADTVPESFTVGGPLNNHLFVAYRTRTSGPNAPAQSQVFVIECYDVNFASCTSATWHVHTFKSFSTNPNDPVPGGQFQPSVSVDVNDVVAVNWYDTVSATDERFSAAGVFSLQGGKSGTWSDPVAFPAPAPQTPCANKQSTDSVGTHSIGEYTATVVIPGQAFQLFPYRPWVVSARADWRGGCQDLGQVTFDEHVQSVVW